LLFGKTKQLDERITFLVKGTGFSNGMILIQQCDNIITLTDELGNKLLLTFSCENCTIEKFIIYDCGTHILITVNNTETIFIPYSKCRGFSEPSIHTVCGYSFQDYGVVLIEYDDCLTDYFIISDIYDGIAYDKTGKKVLSKNNAGGIVIEAEVPCEFVKGNVTKLIVSDLVKK
jgi:hypothetical protein